MKKLIQPLLLIPLAIILIVSCGEDTKNEVENIPPVLIQVWDQSQCKICEDPTMSLEGIGLFSIDLSKSKFLDDYTNLTSKRNEYGDKSMTAKSYVLFKNVQLKVTENFRSGAYFSIEYEYYRRNCTTNRWRKGDLFLGNPGEWSDKNVEWIKNANNGDLFDVLIYEPRFYEDAPSHACDKSYFTIDRDLFGPLDDNEKQFEKRVVLPAGMIDINSTGMYRIKGSQGNFKLISDISKEKKIKETAEFEKNLSKKLGASLKDYKTTSSGLMYRKINKNNSTKPIQGDTIVVNLNTMLLNGDRIGFNFDEPKIIDPNYPSFGISSEDPEATLKERGINVKNGVYITETEASASAYQGGIRKGDILKKIDDVKINNWGDFTSFLQQKKAGDIVNVLLNRNQKSLEFKIKLLKIKFSDKLKLLFKEKSNQNMPGTKDAFFGPYGPLMKGFEEALSILNYGEKGSFIIPSNLAFDKYPFGDIPTNSTLICEIELLSK